MSEQNIAALFMSPEEVAQGRTVPSSTTPEVNHGTPEEDLARMRTSKIDDLVREYLEVRDDLDQKRHEYNAIEREHKDHLERISMVLREKGDALGVDAFPVRGLGTAYRNVKTSYRVANWDSYVKWLTETGNFHCVEKRAAKLAVQEVHRATGEVPPGLDFNQEVEFLVRRN